MQIRFLPYDQSFVSSVRTGGADTYGQPAERAVADGTGVPCRSCLHDTPAGEDFLILAARPFEAPGPYAETGPIFLCAEDCQAWNGAGVPPVLRTSPDYLLKGYSRDHRIVYGTGRVVEASDLSDYASALLEREDIAYVDVRSARNNCFQTRVVRADWRA